MVIAPSMLGQKKRMGTFLKVQNTILSRLHMGLRLETKAQGQFWGFTQNKKPSHQIPVAAEFLIFQGGGSKPEAGFL